jgi:hypothetical protein
MSMSSWVKVQAGYAQGLDVKAGDWLRRPERVRGSVAAVGVYLLLMLGSAVGLYASDSGSGGDIVVAASFAVAFCLPGVFAIWRISTAGLLIDQDLIVIRGLLRTRKIAPAIAVGFEPGVFGFVGNGNPGPVLRVRGGDQIGIWALAREGLVWNFDRYLQEAAPLCDELNRSLEAVNGTAVSGVLLPNY